MGVWDPVLQSFVKSLAKEIMIYLRIKCKNSTLVANSFKRKKKRKEKIKKGK